MVSVHHTTHYITAVSYKSPQVRVLICTEIASLCRCGRRRYKQPIVDISATADQWYAVCYSNLIGICLSLFHSSNFLWNSSFWATVNQFFQSPTSPAQIPAVNRVGGIKSGIVNHNWLIPQDYWQFYHTKWWTAWDRAITAITDCCVPGGWPRLCSITPLHTMSVRCKFQKTLFNHNNSRTSCPYYEIMTVFLRDYACLDSVQLK